MGKWKKVSIRLLLMTVLVLVGSLSIRLTAEAKSGTWKQNSTGWWYSYSDGTYPKNQWLQIQGKWYYFQSSGYMKTGWLQLKGKWYYLNPANGAMVTGWKTIANKTYYFKTDGSMAANEYCQGYWLDKNGVWSYKAKATWRKNNIGWWYQDTKGWCPQNQWVVIDGKDYYFRGSGFLAVNRWIGQYYVGADGAWKKGAKLIDWTEVYQSFLENKEYLGKGQFFSSDPENNHASLYDITGDGIPELCLFGHDVDEDFNYTSYLYFYTCASGNVKYIGEGERYNLMTVIKNKSYPDGILCARNHDDDLGDYVFYGFFSDGKSVTQKAIKAVVADETDGPFSSGIEEMPNYLTLISKFMDMEDPAGFVYKMENLLSISSYSDSEYDYRDDKPFLFFTLDEYYFNYYPVNPLIDDSYAVSNLPSSVRDRFWSSSCYKFDGTKMDWILKNVYNCSDKAIAKLRQMEGDEYQPSYYQNGYYYSQPFTGEGGCRASVVDIQVVNGCYKVRYDIYSYSFRGEKYYTGTMYAVLKQKEGAGTTYLSLYLNTDDEPSDAEIKGIK